ncbi:MAG: AAA family ATPase, partial [Oligoflexia bacterium]|nr:AAA family ATPase [Oligoflexia bacterium]
MACPLPIGSSDFAQIRGEGLTYVDKTGLVGDVVHSNRRVLLLARPRRFGKTLNLTMLRAFFERTDRDAAAIFDGLEVTRAGDDVMGHFQRHPVIYLTFKDVKHRSWDDCIESLGLMLATETQRHAPLLGDARGDLLERIAARRASAVEQGAMLGHLSAALAAATGEQVVILIDEYDTPIHAGFVNGYFDEIITFFRNFLSGGFKDNPHLYRGVVTGILRVAKESIFSGLNNVDVHTVLSSQFGRWFGFTQPEVQALADACGQPQAMAVLRDWYDGYRIGGQAIYNPWSVLNQLVRPGEAPAPWWVNTASDDILRELLIGAGMELQDDLSALIRGQTVTRPVSEHIVLRDVRQDADSLWSFLLFSGYLTVDGTPTRLPDGRFEATLRVPNREVATVYRNLFSTWMRMALSGWSDAPRRLCRAFLEGNQSVVRKLLQRLILETLSYFNLGGKQAEAVYQAFVVGLLVQLQATHDVWSDREGGFGR